MKNISAQEGFVAIGYEKQKYKEYSRLYQYAKIYLYSQSSGLYTCPLAMTDGAAKVIQELGIHDQVGDAFERLTTWDPERFWTSGQWMTERRGGSDVAGGTETLAVPQQDGTHRLYGHKWFSSATDANMSLALARIIGEDNKPIYGTRGLALFYLPMHNADGKLNNIEMIRLKNKLGTRQLPTAELLLDGTVAKKVSEDGRGVASISHMLNTTRIHNATASTAAMRRIISLARDYMHSREAFGKKLVDWPLHIATLSKMELEARGCLLLLMRTALLLGKQEMGTADETELRMLRLLTPIVKLYTAKQVMWIVSEGLECFGGQGYIEDTGLPTIFRDAQVTPIWEGTTNILSLDVCRILAKDYAGTLDALSNDINELIGLDLVDTDLELDHCARAIQDSFIKIRTFPTKCLELGARDFAFSIARTYIGALLVAQAKAPNASRTEIEAANRWCIDERISLLSSSADNYHRARAAANSELVLEGFNRSRL